MIEKCTECWSNDLILKEESNIQVCVACWTGYKLEEKNKWWRPPKFETVEQLEEWIKFYFGSITIDKPRTKSKCVWKIMNAEWKEENEYEDVPVLNNAWEQIIDIEWLEIPSILGLCISLWTHRKTLLEYEEKTEFSNTIKEAKLIIERYNADQLHRTTQVTGVIFNLKNNFWWVDKTESDTNIKWNLTIWGILDKLWDKKIDLTKK